MSLLLDDMPLVISPRLAHLIGLNEAIVLQQIHYWLSDKKQSTGRIINGAKWIYNSITSWEKQFPFMSYRTIQRTLKNLKDAGLLLTGIFNKDKRDKTLWYTIDYKAFNAVARADHARCQNVVLEDDNMADTEHANLVSPLPETTTETTTDINTLDKSLAVDAETIDQPEDDFNEEIQSHHDQPKKTQKQNIPYQKIVDVYNNVCGGLLPQCLKLEKKRKANIQKCWSIEINGQHPFQNLDFWEAYFNDCIEIKFWCGDNDRGWKADIEFLTRESSVLKVLESE